MGADDLGAHLATQTAQDISSHGIDQIIELPLKAVKLVPLEYGTGELWHIKNTFHRFIYGKRPPDGPNAKLKNVFGLLSSL